MHFKPIFAWSLLAVALGQPVTAADRSLNSALDSLDCATLRVDYVRMMPEMIESKPHVPQDQPFSQADLKQLERSAVLDPNGLCHYRDANRALPVAANGRVVFFGDSITEYWQSGDPELFGKAVLDRGISSQTTNQMMLRFQQDVIALKPRVVHILGGINDAMAPNGTLSTRANIVSMVELARAHGITVILGTLTPADTFWLVPDAKLAPFVAEHNRWLRDYAAREHLILADYYTALASPAGKMPAEWSNDGLHPNRLGYARLAPVVRSALRKTVRR